jgi:hypothetical protein
MHIFKCNYVVCRGLKDKNQTGLMIDYRDIDDEIWTCRQCGRVQHLTKLQLTRAIESYVTELKSNSVLYGQKSNDQQ